VIIRGGVAKGERGTDRWKTYQKARLDELCAPGESRSAFLLRYTISHPGMHTTIVGTKNPAHLDENVRATLAGPLPADVYAEAKRRLTAAGELPRPRTKLQRALSRLTRLWS
jgi:aryl-alcohol dehydrogenase-like predicted oxidoreductase